MCRKETIQTDKQLIEGWAKTAVRLKLEVSKSVPVIAKWQQGQPSRV
jgi:hypothetical protein